MDNEKISNSLKKYNEIKRDLLTIVKCIDFCSKEEKEFYQDMAYLYSKHLKETKRHIEEIYDINLCNCHIEKKERKRM
jgi:hypothetical protein